MRNKVVEFFQNLPEDKTEQFNKGFELYRKSENKNRATERNYNVMGFSESNLNNLLYDLQKLHGITDVEKMRVEKTPVIQLLPEYILDFTHEQLQEWAQIECVEKGVGLSEVIALANESGETTIAAALTEVLEQFNTGKVLDINVNKASGTGGFDANALGVGGFDNQVKFKAIREDYPFLDDENCPNELKILVADKITAWRVYEETHEKLKQIEAGDLVVNEAEQTALAKKSVDCFAKNQLIHDELNAYKETGKVLGVHPIFKELQMQREVEEMSSEELIKYKGSSAKYFSDNKKTLKKAKDENDQEKVDEINARVAERGKKLGFVNKKLGIKN